MANPVLKVAGIICNDMQAGRIPNDGLLLLASTSFDEIGVDRARAALKSRFLSDFAAHVIQSEFSNLTNIIHQADRPLEFDDTHAGNAA